MKVGDLKQLNFDVLTMGTKIELIQSGRPVPNLNIAQEQRPYKNKCAFTRRFDKSVYKKMPWICGCEETNAFFCFVCLLFGGDDKWTREGVCDLKNLSTQIKKHEGSKKHKNNFVSFQLLGKTNITPCLSTVCAEAEEMRKHNEKVTKNRYILAKIIDILRLCGQCNLSLPGHSEKEDSKNSGLFLKIVDYTRKLDAAFNSHMQEPHLFKGTSKTVQNELLQCMLDVCRQHITDEIRKSSFLSLMADDTTDVSSQAQTVLVFRYELNGKVHERFWGFAYQESQNAEGLSQCILQQLDSIIEDCPDKLIAQTYDGAAVTRGCEGVNVKIKKKYKNAQFIYCYAHQLNKLLEKAVSNIPSVRMFFANLNGIAGFFSHSPDRRAALQQVCDKRVPRPSQTSWKFQSRIVQTVFNYKEEILQCLENMAVGVPKRYSMETVALSLGFANWFEDITFFFWLSFFSKIMPHVDILFSQLQQIQADALNIQIAIDSFEKAITDIRDDLPSLSDDSQDPLKIDEERPNKRRRLNTDDLNLSAKEVCDTVVCQVRDRFVCKEYLYGTKLFQQECFNEYKRKLPLNDIEQFCKVFTMIDKRVLIMELEVFYSRPELTKETMTGCLKILNFINSFGLDIAFPEITKVLKILVTIPITTSETERCFSTLNNIKSYLRNTVSEDRLTALAMISIEHSMIEAIPNFSEKVIEKFVADDQVRRLEFSFKQ
ncbi:hypothetical protein MTP99_004473 [Tenebrio molitor]|nr:hypothetical protein MTP99_004473 [Tenebrio molitor]